MIWNVQNCRTNALRTPKGILVQKYQPVNWYRPKVGFVRTHFNEPKEIHFLFALQEFYFFGNLQKTRLLICTILTKQPHGTLINIWVSLKPNGLRSQASLVLCKIQERLVLRWTSLSNLLFSMFLKNHLPPSNL